MQKITPGHRELHRHAAFTKAIGGILQLGAPSGERLPSPQKPRPSASIWGLKQIGVCHRSPLAEKSLQLAGCTEISVFNRRKKPKAASSSLASWLVFDAALINLQ